MQIHLVGGFLGSGKTTSIIAAARQLMQRGLLVGVITNDQGKFLVDTAFFRLEDLPTVEVTGGCFCCNYGDLERSFELLAKNVHPDVIFAESVGSCADLVATVVKPLLDLSGEFPPTSFSVFVDARLLRMRLHDIALPFADTVVYVFDKQIEEASLLVVNKCDLLTPAECAELKQLAETRWPDKRIVLQSVYQADQVSHWIDLIDSGRFVPRQTVEVDYPTYGAGEAELAWLDEEIVLHAPAAQAAPAFLRGLLQTLQTQNAPVGHVKVILDDGVTRYKQSFTTVADPSWAANLPAFTGPSLRILLNARVQMSAEDLQSLVRSAVESLGIPATHQNIQAFHPGYPNPTHRM